MMDVHDTLFESFLIIIKMVNLDSPSNSRGPQHRGSQLIEVLKILK